jgi:hypothetical protein
MRRPAKPEVCNTQGVNIRIVRELAAVSGLTPAAKAVYVTAMTNELTCIQALADKVGLDRRPVLKHCRELEKLGWMQISRNGMALLPAAVVPRPVELRLAAEIRDVIRMSPYKGEATAKALAVWIVSPRVRLIFNARPQFLQNAETGQNLECDIYTPDYSWSGEYQGDQHFGPTEQYPGDKEFVDRFRRDHLKAQLCKQHGITLTPITKHDLTLERMLGLIPERIPRRVFDPNGPIVVVLEQLGREIAKGRDWDRV